ncbi:hypothetical protein KAR91_09005 [Candidatus Pacearchaeota archaeon]|nr:hypothetical protein [Candidatus Pacearchaeota archaeon]
MREISGECFKVSFNDSDEVRDAVFEKVLEYFEEYECFCGESIMQSDDPIIYAPHYMSQIADDIIKFNVEWED